MLRLLKLELGKIFKPVITTTAILTVLPVSLPAFSKETIPFISISTHGKLELNILHCSFPCSLRYQCVGSSIMNGATALLFIRFLEFQGKSI